MKHTSPGRTPAATLFIPALLAATMLLVTASCRRAPQWRVCEGAVWHTSYRIVYASPVSLDDSITAMFGTVERSLSPFNPLSLISRINRGETSRTDTLIDRVFEISRQVSLESHGRFDPTVSPLVDLWGFGTDRAARLQAETDSAGSFAVEQWQIDSALAIVGIGDCHISNSEIIRKHPATSFNFSAVTKGYACDLISEMLRRNGAGNHMVEIGGEIALSGHNPDNARWRIQVDTPDSSSPMSHNSLKVINLTGCGIATSGNYRNFHDTRRYGRIGHTIDPVTGRPATTDILSATVIAPTAALADAWATACMASTADSAIAIISRQPEVECLLVTAADTTLRIMTTPLFPDK